MTTSVSDILWQNAAKLRIITINISKSGTPTARILKNHANLFYFPMKYETPFLVKNILIYK